MTKNHFKPLEDPPTESSSDDMHFDTTSDYDDEEHTIFSSDEEEPIATSIPASSVTVTTSVKKEEDDFWVVDTQAPTQAVKSETKRRSEATLTDVNSKRAKKDITSEDEEKIGEETKRLWSEADEIAMLGGIIIFRADTDKSPSEDRRGFYNFVKKSISFDVSYDQTMSKIRSLKRKYIRRTNNGVEPTLFSSADDKKSYELSKFIWGDEGFDSIKSNEIKSSKKSSPNDKEVEDNTSEYLNHGTKSDSDWFEKSDLVRSFSILGGDEDFVKERWSKVPIETKKKFEEKWNLLKAKELEFVLQKADFLHEVTSLIAKSN